MTETSTYSGLVAECRAALLRTLEAFARNLGYARPDCLAAVKDAAGESYDELAGLRGRRGFEQARGLTASRISLVHEHDLSFTLELSDLERRLREYCDVSLGRLHLRFMTLLSQDDAVAEQLPVGPETVCRSLRALAESAGLDGDERLELVERCMPTLGDHLKTFYQSLDARLASAGIEMKPLGRPAQSAAHADPVAPARTSETTHQPITAEAAIAEAGAAPLAGLHRALLKRRTSPSDAPVTVDPQLAASIVAQIRMWLSDQQQSGAQAPRIGASGLGQFLDPMAAAAIEALELVFDGIAVESNVPDPVKSIIASLQIPFLKLALSDDRLLADKDHPALPLIDALAMAGNSLPMQVDAHPGFERLAALTRTLAQVPELHKQDLKTALRQVQTFIDERRRMAMAAAEPALGIAAKAERREAARLFASRALGVLMDDDTPAAIRYFLRKHWVQVLARTLYKHGEKHPDWRAQLEIANEVVMSGRAGPDGRMPQEQVEALPGLISRIESGLATLGLGQQARDAAMADCREHHSALIAGRPPQIAYASTAAPDRMTLSRARELPELLMLHHTGYAAPKAHASNLHAALSPGTWLELELPDDSRMHGCIAWVGQGRKIALIADPDSGRLLIATMKCLSDLQREQHLYLRNVASLTEKAANAALQGMGG
ncbi:MAG TPA: DUF1631 family protein [Rhodocyclaceae bacterium]|nr:DUF1631 family protein [Rhodocyclaceae bacterium]